MALTITHHGEHFDPDVHSSDVETDWRHGVTYQLYPRSFADGNGDGVGDLVGALAHVEYLKELGVDAVWVSPWYPSPMADGGYDVSDYRDIHPLFGSLRDADDFIAACHRLGLRVLIDIVPNHCSSAHPWFQSALASAPGSPARDWFYFRDGRGANGEEPPTDWVSVFGGPAWTRVTNADGTPGQWYLHLFDSAQPDLNWGNRAVRAAFEEIFRFWFDRGVDGFRLDAVPAIGKDPTFVDVGANPHLQFAPETSPPMPFWDAGQVHEVVREWRAIADAYEPAKYLVGEINVSTPSALLRYLRPGELQSVFAFNLTKSPWRAEEFRRRIEGNLNRGAKGASWATWILSSHDEVRSVTRYAQLDDGAVDLEVGARRARAALLVTLALPGAVCLYQGEELGLPQVTDLPRELLEDPIVARTGEPAKGRDGCRVALPWDESAPAFGFGAPPRLPQPASWGALSVAAQERDENSFLHFTRRALHARRHHLDGANEECEWLELGDRILAFDRGALRCIVNFGEQPYRLDDADHVVVASSPLVDGHLGRDTGVWLRR